jgi:hypothetical protein
MELVTTSLRGTPKVVRRSAVVILVMCTAMFAAAPGVAQTAPRTRPLPATPSPTPVPLPVVPEPVAPGEFTPVAAVPTFQEFVASTTRTPAGSYVVEHDMVIGDISRLEAYYLKYIAGQQTFGRGTLPVDPSEPSTNLAIKTTTTGADARWSDTQKLQLTYCISTDWHQFGGGFEHDDYYFIEQAVRNAAESWEAVANVNFTHVPTEDSNCNSSNTNVLLRVIPWAQAPYIAQAFFPDSHPNDRFLIVNPGSVPIVGGQTSLSGAMRHELGHILGFVHEHGRVVTPNCQTESVTRRDLTTYDSMSVMHYNFCYGGDYDYFLTQNDIDGVRSVYGASPLPPSPNHQPVARIGSPFYSGVTGRQIVFDGTGSSDSDGNALTYIWSFGDGTPDAYTTVPVAGHTYKTPGNFTVSLTVNDGNWSSITVTTTALIADIRWLPAVLNLLME